MSLLYRTTLKEISISTLFDSISKRKLRTSTLTLITLRFFLNSELGRSLSIREITGGTRPALDYKALNSLKIILPPIKVQNEIVGEVKQCLTKVEELRQEADAIVEEAKREVERVMLEGMSG